MVCLGSKSFQRKARGRCNLSENCEYFNLDAATRQYVTRRMKKDFGKKKENTSLPKSQSHTANQTRGKSDDSSIHDGRNPNEKAFKHGKGNHGLSNDSIRLGNHKHTFKPSILRKKVDPETAKYFLEISNLFDGDGVDLEERPFICSNALGETRGKELELATDIIISRTLQTLLEGCGSDQLCSFLHSCANDFSSIAMDKCGSHVAETALKSLTVHLQDHESVKIIENTLTKICQAVVVDSVNVMSSMYGSHVIRSLLCLCKGVPLDSLEEFHLTKASSVLAERLKTKSYQYSNHNLNFLQQSFPILLKFLVRELLKHAKDEMPTLRANKYSSFVLQTALKLLVGDDDDLMHAILAIFGYSEENVSKESFFNSANMHEAMELFKDTSSSHLFEVILEVAPNTLYHEILEKLFKGLLFEFSTHQCGNFVVQALISSARDKSQINMIWEELGLKIRDLLSIGKPGVAASLIAACQRFQTHDHECCDILAAAVCSESEQPSSIVPHLLYLEGYLSCKDASKWKWPSGEKMHVLGCLMLQSVFRYSKIHMNWYIKSMVSIKADQILEIAKDSGGSRVLESFLCSDASTKEKLEVISKLQDHFGELSLHPSGSFTVEKCFNAGNLFLKEVIVSELASVIDDLSKKKHGPYILKKFDVNLYVKQPEYWKSSREKKEAVYKEFQAEFGSDNNGKVAANQSQSTNRKNGNGMVNHVFSSSSDQEFLDHHFSGFKIGSKHGLNTDIAETVGLRPSKKGPGSSFLRRGKRKSSSFEHAEQRDAVKRKPSFELADLASKRALSHGEVHKLFRESAGQVKQSAFRKTNFVKQSR